MNTINIAVVGTLTFKVIALIASSASFNLFVAGDSSNVVCSSAERFFDENKLLFTSNDRKRPRGFREVYKKYSSLVQRDFRMYIYI